MRKHNDKYDAQMRLSVNLPNSTHKKQMLFFCFARKYKGLWNFRR